MGRGFYGERILWWWQSFFCKIVDLSLDINHPFYYYIKTFAAVAQLVERRTENPYVVGSIPTCGTWLLTQVRSHFFCLNTCFTWI